MNTKYPWNKGFTWYCSQYHRCTSKWRFRRQFHVDALISGNTKERLSIGCAEGRIDQFDSRHIDNPDAMIRRRSERLLELEKANPKSSPDKIAIRY